MKRDPEQLVAEFLTEYEASGHYRRDCIDSVSDLATSPDAASVESATRAVFTFLVEPLADSFTPEAVSLYNRVFAQFVHSCRKKRRCEALNRALSGFGLGSEDDLIGRAENLRKVTPLPSTHEAAAVERVVVLSRVTLGADVAITSVIMDRIKSRFPDAEVVLLGGSKASELFGGDSRIRFKEVDYRRTGTMIERLLSWITLIEGVKALNHCLEPHQHLVVDPDCRLTQLGVLPVVEDRADGSPRNYLFFPSREYGQGESRSLGELTSRWLDQVIGEESPSFPTVCLNAGDIQVARNLISRLKKEGSRPIVTINFGVGENQLKRVGDEFEMSLVARLIHDRAVVVLDKGASEQETRRADQIVRRLTENSGVQALELDRQTLMSMQPDSNRLDAALVTWQGRIGVLSSLIGESDLYIGYDSAGQHIAAALEVPCIDVFAGFKSNRFVERWRPTGKGETRVVPVDTLNGAADVNSVLSQVLRHAEALLNK